MSYFKSKPRKTAGGKCLTSSPSVERQVQSARAVLSGQDVPSSIPTQAAQFLAGGAGDRVILIHVYIAGCAGVGIILIHV